MDTAGVTRGREEAEEVDVYVAVVVVQSDMFQLSEKLTSEEVPLLRSETMKPARWDAGSKLPCADVARRPRKTVVS